MYTGVILLIIGYLASSQQRQDRDGSSALRMSYEVLGSCHLSYLSSEKNETIKAARKRAKEMKVHSLQNSRLMSMSAKSEEFVYQKIRSVSMQEDIDR